MVGKVGSNASADWAAVGRHALGSAPPARMPASPNHAFRSIQPAANTRACAHQLAHL